MCREYTVKCPVEIELDLSPLEAEIILQALEPVAEEYAAAAE